MFKKLFEDVRVSGNIHLPEGPCIRDKMPVIYCGEADSVNNGSTRYYNSGGRSLIFNLGNAVYRIKGVDPQGQLTERVTLSGKNRIRNVADAYRLVQAQIVKDKPVGSLKFSADKPFGPFFRAQAEKEITAFEYLGEIYPRFGIENPCKSLMRFKTGIEHNGSMTYQTAFELPRKESDFRVHEFDKLLIERLDQCSSVETSAKSKNILRLYGRFMYWAGVNVALLAHAGLVPTEASFHPQNWVISKHNDGYGIFRVDHTSTDVCDNRIALERMLEKKEGLPSAIHEFSVFSERLQVAANPSSFLPSDKVGLKFSELLSINRLKHRADITNLLVVHENMFNVGLTTTLQGRNPEAIPEQMFRDALN